MSRVPYTINVDEYICGALEQIRKMNDNRDYSGLAAAVERIQHHANQMENALYAYENLYGECKDALTNEKYTDEAKFRKRIEKLCKRTAERKGDKWPEENFYRDE